MKSSIEIVNTLKGAMKFEIQYGDGVHADKFRAYKFILEDAIGEDAMNEFYSELLEWRKANNI